MSQREAYIDKRAALCRVAAEALNRRPGATWVREMAPLTLAERAIVTSHVRKEREKRSAPPAGPVFDDAPSEILQSDSVEGW